MHESQECDNHMKSDTCILYICEDHIWLTNYVRFPKPRARGPSGSCYITVMVGGNWGRRIRPCSQQILPSRLIGVLPCLRLRLGNYTGIFWALGMVQGLFIQFQISIYIYIWYDMIWYDWYYIIKLRTLHIAYLYIYTYNWILSKIMIPIWAMFWMSYILALNKEMLTPLHTGFAYAHTGFAYAPSLRLGPLAMNTRV